MTITLNKKRVSDFTVDGSYPDLCIIRAVWYETDELLTSSELEQLEEEQPELAHELVMFGLV